MMLNRVVRAGTRRGGVLPNAVRGWPTQRTPVAMAVRWHWAEDEAWEFVPPPEKKVDKGVWKLNRGRAAGQVPGERLSGAEVVELLEEEGAMDVVCMELGREVFLGDSMVVATGRSESHLEAMAEMLAGVLKARGLADRRNVEGGTDGWYVVDCISVFVHLCLAPARERLQLESYYNDEAQKLIYNDDLDLMVPANVVLYSGPPQTAKERRRQRRRRLRGNKDQGKDYDYYLG